MLAMGCTQSQGDHTLFVKHSATGEVTILVVYVDDIIVTGNDPTERDSLPKCLAKEFEIKELGKMKYFLGSSIFSKHDIFLSQTKYVLDLLKETGTLGCKAASTPIEPNHKMIGDKDDTTIEKGRYQRLVGKLIYLSHTRSDIAYVVNVVNQFMHDPKERHLQAVHSILHYLKATTGRGILFKKGKELTLEAYIDVDYASSIIDRRSTSSYYCTFLGDNLVTWRSKKQPMVARSTEAEFRAMAHGVYELFWLKIILDDIRVKKGRTDETLLQ
ncbi:UNVERIFIED_CONTAM: Retrovirus-related Pol polyprotein from transposon RE1 [Sesamum latifolium]|uniref:Retrovirus-related Pol polyprotein from transposon RE1 n=1 Tax=Sesamum latifolium TaxID=2727402 RepID=A0AAW2Y0L3_9LAMI